MVRLVNQSPLTHESRGEGENPGSTLKEVEGTLMMDEPLLMARCRDTISKARRAVS